MDQRFYVLYDHLLPTFSAAYRHVCGETRDGQLARPPRGYKPPAVVNVDDRAVPFRGDWDQVIVEIRNFRR